MTAKGYIVKFEVRGEATCGNLLEVIVQSPEDGQMMRENSGQRESVIAHPNHSTSTDGRERCGLQCVNFKDKTNI